MFCPQCYREIGDLYINAQWTFKVDKGENEFTEEKSYLCKIHGHYDCIKDAIEEFRHIQGQYIETLGTPIKLDFFDKTWQKNLKTLEVK